MIEEGIRSGAILNPTILDGLEANGLATLTITFKIKESELTAWRKLQKDGA
jgi:hypothetical protein